MTELLSTSSEYTSPFIDTPWDNRNGWLGVKHQITYLPFIDSFLGVSTEVTEPMLTEPIT